MQNNRELVLNFGAKTFDTDATSHRLKEDGFTVVSCELVDPRTLAVSWEGVSFAYVYLGLSNNQNVLERLSYVSQRVPVIAILHSTSTDSSCQDVRVVSKQARRSGAAVVLGCDASEDEQRKAVDRAIWLRKLCTQLLAMMVCSQKFETLSPRQRQILKLAADGEANKRIAKILGVCISTVERSRSEAYRHLSVKNYAQMIRAVVLAETFRSTAQRVQMSPAPAYTNNRNHAHDQQTALAANQMAASVSALG